MAASRARSFLLLAAVTAAAVILNSVNPCSAGGELEVGFYRRTCPEVEPLVRKAVGDAYRGDPTVAAKLLRLHFHDCFVRGCDGSVLINSTAGCEPAEKDAKPNLTLGGFAVIDAAKAELERHCPGVVSCADIVAIAARDAVSLATAAAAKHFALSPEGNLYEVETGRRDGTASTAGEALKNLPSSYFGIRKLKKLCRSKGLTLRDIAALSGGHALGTSHCFSISRRLHNFTAEHAVDPTLDGGYAAELRGKCGAGGASAVLEMVPGSSTVFGAKYYELVTERKGMFHSDQALLRSKKTRELVVEYRRSESSFFRDFGEAMVHMGRVGVLTGGAGEIRRNCAAFN